MDLCTHCCACHRNAHCVSAVNQRPFHSSATLHAYSLPSGVFVVLFSYEEEEEEEGETNNKKVKVIEMQRAEFMIYEKRMCLGVVKALKAAYKELIGFPAHIRCMGDVYDWEEQLKIIEKIRKYKKEKKMDLFQEELVEYVNEFGVESMGNLVDYWNQCQKKANKTDLIFEKNEIPLTSNSLEN